LILVVVKLLQAEKGFVLLSQRWMARFRRLTRDDERLPLLS
jgi:hypothetical protein